MQDGGRGADRGGAMMIVGGREGLHGAKRLREKRINEKGHVNTVGWRYLFSQYFIIQSRYYYASICYSKLRDKCQSYKIER